MHLTHAVTSIRNRYSEASIVALFGTWSGLPLVIPFVVVLMGVGAILGAIGGSTNLFAQHLHMPGVTGGIGSVVGVALGFVFALVIVFHVFLHGNATTGYVNILLAMAGGGLLALALLAIDYQVELYTLRLRGYRKPSRREAQRVYPLLDDLAERMELPTLPQLLVSDALKPGAWAHMHVIVVTRGLLGDVDETERPPSGDFDNQALAAVLGHELHHWDVGDPIALRFVWFCCWPLVLLYNGASWLTRTSQLAGSIARTSAWVGVIVWCIIWPVAVVLHGIMFVMRTQSRAYEYQADARVAALGDEYRLGLRKALTTLSVWEQPRTGWEKVLLATHPPTELRMDRLEGTADYTP